MSRNRAAGCPACSRLAQIYDKEKEPQAGQPAARFSAMPALIIVALCLAIGAGCGGHTAAVPSPPPVASNQRLVIAYNGEEGKTVLEILKARARVRTSTSSLGELVEEINGMKSTDHEHLLFFVNGEMSDIGAGGYITKAGDRIEWKLVGPKNSSPGGKN